MVLEAQLNGRHVQVCELCGLAYPDSRLAMACEQHCIANDSCSLSIGRQSVGIWDGPLRERQ